MIAEDTHQITVPFSILEKWIDEVYKLDSSIDIYAIRELIVSVVSHAMVKSNMGYCPLLKSPYDKLAELLNEKDNWDVLGYEKHIYSYIEKLMHFYRIKITRLRNRYRHTAVFNLQVVDLLVGKVEMLWSIKVTYVYTGTQIQNNNTRQQRVARLVHTTCL